MLTLVPNSLRDAINGKLDAAFASLPEEAKEHRQQFFDQLLAYYDENGRLPDFHIAPVSPS